MKTIILAWRHYLLIVTGISILFLNSGCNQSSTPTKTNQLKMTLPMPVDFGFVFGYDAICGDRREIDTFKNKFSRKLGFDEAEDPGTSIELTLTKDELNRVYKIMVENDIFNYPDNLSTFESSPLLYYNYLAKNGAQTKRIYWGKGEASNLTDNQKVFLQLSDLIIHITDAYPEVQKLEKIEPKIPSMCI